MRNRFNEPTRRLRAGFAEPLLITPFHRSLSSGLARGDVGAPVVAWARCHKKWDVQVGDLLIFPDDQYFVVRQLEPEQQTMLLSLGEIAPIIPDEFESGAVNAWWDVSAGSSFAIDQNEFHLEIDPPPAETLKVGAHLTQLSKSYDFDVWCALRCDPLTSLLTASTRFALLGASSDDFATGVYVGLRTGLNTNFVRIDEYEGEVLETIEREKIMPGQWGWVRLKRSGLLFRAFYSPLDPKLERDWIEIFSTPAKFFSETGAVRVGLTGFRSTFGLSNLVSWDFVRNWKGA